MADVSVMRPRNPFDRLSTKDAERLIARGEAAVNAAAPYLKGAVNWGQEQSSRLGRRLSASKAMETWIRESAIRYGWSEKLRSNSLEHLERLLVGTVAAIRQDSEKRTRIIIRSVIGKTTTAFTVGGIGTMITMFGTASTGAAIGGLHGAAATTAQLYLLGSTIGLGVAAGGVILTATGIGAGITAAFLGVRWMIGKRRGESDLQDHEKAIVVAAATLIEAVQKQIKSGIAPSRQEMLFVAEQVLVPLVNDINRHWDERALTENEKTECRPFTRTLALIHLRKLDRCRTELGRIALAAMTRPKEG